MMRNNIFSNLLGIICSVFDAYSAVFFMPDGREDGVGVASFFSLGKKIDTECHISNEQGLVGYILSNKKPLLVQKIDQSPSRLGYYRHNEDAPIKAFMGCPVRGGGVLCIDSTRQYSFSDKDQKILYLFTELLADFYVADTNRNVDDALQSYFTSLSLLHELRFRYTQWSLCLRQYLKLLCSVTGFDNCIFISADATRNGYVVDEESSPLMLKEQKGSPLFPMDAGLVGWVFNNGTAVFADGLDNSPLTAVFGRSPDLPEFPAVICMPIIVHRATRGVLCFTAQTARPISQNMRSFVAMAVDIIALHLESLYLRARLRAMTQ